MDKKQIQNISAKTEQSIKRKTAYGLPDRPSESGMRADEIKKAFYSSITDSEDSVMSELKRIVKETNEVLDEIQDDVNDKISKDNAISLDFAESERQKSKNLFDINGIRKGKALLSDVGGIADNNNYFVSNDMVVAGLSHIVMSGGVGTSGYLMFYDIDFVWDKIIHYIGDGAVFEVPENAVYCRFECQLENVNNPIQVEKGTEVTDYHPYCGGQIARFGDIADVEHIDVLYYVKGGKTTLGGRDYGSGIAGGVTVENLDLSKYKYLDFTVTFTGDIEMTIRMDLTTAYANQYWVFGRCGTEDTKLNDAGKRVPVNNVYTTSIVVNKDKTSISHEYIGYFIGATGEYTNRDTSVNDGQYDMYYSIKRIEGVY